jgi:acyl carrier protein
MEELNALKRRLKTILVENLMLQVGADEIGDDQPLFGPGSLGLDSVDALQLVVALDKNFGLKVPDPAAAKEVLQSVSTMATAVQRNAGQGSEPKRSS